jgi:hypothetical protein
MRYQTKQYLLLLSQKENLNTVFIGNLEKKIGMYMLLQFNSARFLKLKFEWCAHRLAKLDFT